MITRVRRYLIQYSRHQSGTVSYLTVVQDAELGLNLDISHEKARLNELLAEISENEYAAGRPILSSLVKVEGSKGQGDNFFKLCERLGLGPWRELKQNPEFLPKLRADCREFWRNEENFAQFS
ncbi:hypothetical protein GCM10027048_27270 [Hymenobacter coalescens]